MDLYWLLHVHCYTSAYTLLHFSIYWEQRQFLQKLFDFHRRNPE